MIVLQDQLASNFAGTDTSSESEVADGAVVDMESSGPVGAITLHGQPTRLGSSPWPQVARTSRIADENQVRSRVLALERSRASTWDWDLSTDAFRCSGESEGLYGHRRQPPPRNGATWLLRIHRDDRERVAAEFGRCREGRSDALCVEYRVNLDETRTRWVLTRGGLANTLHPESRCMVGMTVDVTLLREADLALRLRMVEAIEQISGGVAHDLNNLLSIISNLAELQGGGRGSSQIAEFGRQIVSTAARGALLTRKLSLLGNPGGACNIALAEGLGGISDLVGLSAEERVDVRFGIDVDVWPVHVDPSALQLAVLNLAINGGHGMSDGGTVTVTAANSVLSCGRSEELHLGNDEFVEIQVSDTGPGMSADTLDRVFELDPSAKSMGPDARLGLAQVHAFAGSSGGAVRVRSTQGIGTTITLYLPRAVPAVGMSA